MSHGRATVTFATFRRNSSRRPLILKREAVFIEASCHRNRLNQCRIIVADASLVDPHRDDPCLQGVRAGGAQMR